MKNVLILGAGVAGICLSRQFISAGINVTIIDSGKNFSTRIAAGMINPMTFRKMVKTWEGDVLIPYLTSFYERLEKDSNERFFFKREIRRVFSTEHELVLWEQRLHENGYENYLEPVKNNTPAYIQHAFGSGKVNAPGYIDSLKFITAAQEWLKKHADYRIETFDFHQVDAENTYYKGKKYDWIIFAEGYRGKENPFFGYLPLQQTKGEVLTVSVDGIDRTEIVNRKCFVLPTEDGYAKLGATFSWNTTDTSPTINGREELLNQYQELMALPIQIIDHEAGIRPTVTDRRPLLGKHLKYPTLVVFNGMGTKGYMLAPYFSEILLNHLLMDTPLPVEVDIKRFEKHFHN